MPTCGIYKLSIIGDDGHERFCYGRSVDIDRRLRQHARLLAAGRHRNERVQNTYRRYGNLSHSIVAVCGEGCLPEIEGMFVHTHYKDPMCMNIEAVDPNGAVRASEDTKRKIGAANKGRPKTEDGRRRISESNKSRGPVSEDTRRRMSLAKIGKRFTKEHKDRIGEANSKPIEMLGPSGERIVFQNITVAAKHFGLSGASALSAILRGHKPWPTRPSSVLAGWTGRYIKKEREK